MREISLNILDIAQNSIRAGATVINIEISENDSVLEFKIQDNGRGMSRELLSRAADPFTTTRKERNVGLGLSLLKTEAEMTGGKFSILSKSESDSHDHGTCVNAEFLKSSIDCPPLGNIIATVCALIQAADGIDIIFIHKMNKNAVRLSTLEMREYLGDIPLSLPDIAAWTKCYLEECYKTL